MSFQAFLYKRNFPQFITIFSEPGPKETVLELELELELIYFT